MALLRRFLEPATPEDRLAHHEICTLLEHMVVHQVESSSSQLCELDASQRTPSEQPDKDASVHQASQGGRLRTMVLVHEPLGRNRDTRDTLDAHRRARGDMMKGASRDYHLR